MHGVAVLLAAASAAYLVARLLRVPAIPLLLLAGLGLSLLGVAPTDILEDAVVLGVSFLLFIVGLELEPRRVRAQRAAALRVGAVQFGVLAVLGFAAARALGLDLVESAYVALALTASSTLVGVRLLQRRRRMFEPFGRLVLGVLLLQDVLVLLLIPLVTGLGAGWGAALRGTAGLVALGGMCLLARRWAGPLLLRVAHEAELVLLASLALLFLFLGASTFVGLPVVVGAFLAGVGLSRFPVNGIVRTELAPVGDFFSAVFFTALGALVRVPTPVELAHASILVLLVVVVTPPLVTLVARRTGFTTRPGMEAGLLLSQTSEISLVVGVAGMIHGQVGEATFVLIALVTFISMLLTPFLANDRVAARLTHLWPRRPPASLEVPSDHVLLLGAGATGMPLLEDLVLSGCPVVVVDDDPGVVDQLMEAGITAVRGEATDPRILERARAAGARAVVSTIRRPRDSEAVLAITRGAPVLVRTFDEADAAWIRERGGTPVLYSEATADALMSWYALNEDDLRQGSVARRGGRSARRGPAPA